MIVTPTITAHRNKRSQLPFNIEDYQKCRPGQTVRSVNGSKLWENGMIMVAQDIGSTPTVQYGPLRG